MQPYRWEFKGMPRFEGGEIIPESAVNCQYPRVIAVRVPPIKPRSYGEDLEERASWEILHKDTFDQRLVDASDKLMTAVDKLRDEMAGVSGERRPDDEPPIRRFSVLLPAEPNTDIEINAAYGSDNVLYSVGAYYTLSNSCEAPCAPEDRIPLDPCIFFQEDEIMDISERRWEDMSYEMYHVAGNIDGFPIESSVHPVAVLACHTVSLERYNLLRHIRPSPEWRALVAWLQKQREWIEGLLPGEVGTVDASAPDKVEPPEQVSLRNVLSWTHEGSVDGDAEGLSTIARWRRAQKENEDSCPYADVFAFCRHLLTEPIHVDITDFPLVMRKAHLAYENAKTEREKREANQTIDEIVELMIECSYTCERTDHQMRAVDMAALRCINWIAEGLMIGLPPEGFAPWKPTQTWRALEGIDLTDPFGRAAVFPKWDGEMFMVAKPLFTGKIRLFTSKGLPRHPNETSPIVNWIDRFPRIQTSLLEHWNIPHGSLLYGELVCFRVDDRGVLCDRALLGTVLRLSGTAEARARVEELEATGLVHFGLILWDAPMLRIWKGYTTMRPPDNRSAFTWTERLSLLRKYCGYENPWAPAPPRSDDTPATLKWFAEMKSRPALICGHRRIPFSLLPSLPQSAAARRMEGWIVSLDGTTGPVSKGVTPTAAQRHAYNMMREAALVAPTWRYDGKVPRNRFTYKVKCHIELDVVLSWDGKMGKGRLSKLPGALQAYLMDEETRNLVCIGEVGTGLTDLERAAILEGGAGRHYIGTVVAFCISVDQQMIEPRFICFRTDKGLDDLDTIQALPKR